MCTVSWWRRDGHLSLRFNRDEQKGRPVAEPPAKQNGLLYPKDPQGGGTWICVDSRGTIHCLLNYYDADDPIIPQEPRTRGELPLLSAQNPSPLQAWLNPGRYPPFHLLRIPLRGPIEHMCWDSHQCFSGPPHAEITHWTTSGWNASEVVRFRAELFHRMMTEKECSEKAFDDFHRYQDPSRTGFGPRMSRANARTVSISEIKVDPKKIFFQYTPVDDEGMLPTHETTLSI